MSRTVSKNIFWLTVSRALALVLLFAAYTRLFRYLGPEKYGQYQFVLSYVMLFSTVVDFGIQQFITKKISENPGEKKKYFHSFLAFECLVAVLLYISLIAVSVFGDYGRETTVAIAIAGLGMVANALTYPFLAVMTAFQDLKKVAYINFLNSLVNIAVIALAIWLGKGIVFLSSIQVLFGLMDLVLYRLFIRNHLPQPEVGRGLKTLDLGLIKGILKSAWPFVLLVGFSAIYNRIDVVIITKLRGFEETGYYGAAYKIFDLLAFFPSVVSHTLFPFFASLMARRQVEEVRQGLEKYLRLMIAVALPMAVGGMLLSRPLISLIAGPQYEPAAPILSILIWAPAILFVYIPVNSLVISQLTKKAVAITGANVFINILGNIILIPIYGIKAAAVMTIVSESLQGIFYFYFVRKNITRFRFLSLLIKPLAASSVMAAALWLLKDQNLALSVVAGGLAYAAVLLSLGFVSKDDYLFLKSIFSSNPQTDAQ